MRGQHALERHSVRTQSVLRTSCKTLRRELKDGRNFHRLRMVLGDPLRHDNEPLRPRVWIGPERQLFRYTFPRKAVKVLAKEKRRC